MSTYKQNHDLWQLDNTYLSLPNAFYAIQKPPVFPDPTLVYVNRALGASLEVTFKHDQAELWAKRLTGVLPPKGHPLIALAYAGHQYGSWTQLGDGRALLLGERTAQNGDRYDLHLKGSGATAFARGFDGKGTLRSMLKEALISEAMHALGVPTTRVLSVTKTGETVRRERCHAGAVLCRVASSHVRFGTFEYAATLDDATAALGALLDYVIKRHDPTLLNTADSLKAWLKAVASRQAYLIAHWQRVGFVHGVMNTDNVSIAGETIDYGPCAFMNRYDEQTVFSSIDHQGRYAFGQQPYIASWNLAKLTEALVPVLGQNRSEAVQIAQMTLEYFAATYTKAWQSMMAKKLGFLRSSLEIERLVENLLSCMQTLKLDYTNTFVALTRSPHDKSLPDHPRFTSWRENWLRQLSKEKITAKARQVTMAAANPALIPRNHQVEDVLDAAEKGDMLPFEAYLAALESPYNHDSVNPLYQEEPDPNMPYFTTCGT